MISVIFLDVLLFISIYASKKLTHPAVIVSGIWTIILNLYVFSENELYPLSQKLQDIIVLWVLVFIISSLLSSSHAIKIKNRFKKQEPNIYFIKKIYPIICIGNLIFIFSVLKEIGGAFNLEALINTREGLLEDHLPLYIKLLFYFNSFSTVYLIVVTLYSNILSKRNYIILFIIILLATIVKTNKTAIVSLACSLIYVYNERGILTKSKLIVIVIAIITILYLSIFLRGDVNDSFDISRYLIIYTLSPLAAMDMVINGDYSISTGTAGSSTFIVLYKILNLFGFNFEIASRGEWVNVPFPTNVFTTFRGFYLDFGIYGILFFSFILGSLWGIIYRWAKKGFGIFIVFYSLMIYSLVLQFFADYFFITFSTTFQYIFFSIILFIPIKILKN